MLHLSGLCLYWCFINMTIIFGVIAILGQILGVFRNLQSTLSSTLYSVSMTFLFGVIATSIPPKRLPRSVNRNIYVMYRLSTCVPSRCASDMYVTVLVKQHACLALLYSLPRNLSDQKIRNVPPFSLG